MAGVGGSGSGGGDAEMSGWIGLLHSSTKLLEQAAPTPHFPTLQRNLDQLEALSTKLKTKTIHAEAPSQSLSAIRLLAREGINAEQLARDLKSFELKTNFEDVFPSEATTVEEYLQQLHEVAIVSSIQEAQKDNLKSFNNYMMQVLEMEDVYEITYDTCGQYWPNVHHYIFLSDTLMQTTMIGMFGLKSKPGASLIPLLVLNILYNEYCKVRFLPTFQHRPVQVAKENDELDEAEGMAEGNLDTVVGAYKPPWMRPTNLEYSSVQPLIRKHVLSSFLNRCCQQQVVVKFFTMYNTFSELYTMPHQGIKNSPALQSFLL